MAVAPYTIAQLNHYWTRSFEEWLIKIDRGYSLPTLHHTPEGIYYADLNSTIVDTKIWDVWGDKLKAVLLNNVSK